MLYLQLSMFTMSYLTFCEHGNALAKRNMVIALLSCHIFFEPQVDNKQGKMK